MPFHTAEAALRYVRNTQFSESAFTLEIADDLTFAGHADTEGAGMAVVLDAVLEKGFSPDGYEQKVGFRRYRYRRTE
jgi:hypothetical protein